MPGKLKKTAGSGSLERIVSQHWTTLICALECAAWWEDSLAEEWRGVGTASKYRRLRKRLLRANEGAKERCL